MDFIEKLKYYRETHLDEVEIIDEPEKLNIKLYNMNNKFIGIINTSFQMYEVRCQIKENALLKKDEFYTIEFDDGDSFKIDNYGRLEREAKYREELCIFENFLNILL